jgi:hypothetical protein
MFFASARAPAASAGCARHQHRVVVRASAKPDDDDGGRPPQRRRRRQSTDADDPPPPPTTRRFQQPIPRKEMQKRARVERERAVYSLPGARVEGQDLVVDLAVAASGAAATTTTTPREAAAAAARAAGAALNARLRARAARLRTWREAAALVAESGPEMDYLTVAAVCVRVGELLAPGGVLRPLAAGDGDDEEEQEQDRDNQLSAAVASLATRDRLLLRPLAALVLERADWFQAPHFAAVASALALAGFGASSSSSASSSSPSSSSSSEQEQESRLLSARFWREFARLARRKVRSMTLPQLSALCAALASASGGGGSGDTTNNPILFFRPSLAWCDMVSRAAARRLVGQRLVARRLKSPGFLGAPDPRRPSVARLKGGARREAAAQAGDLGALLWAFARWGYAPAGRSWASDALVQVRVAADAAREARVRKPGPGAEAAAAAAAAAADCGEGAARRAAAQALGWLSSVTVREAAAVGADSSSSRIARRLAPRRSWLAAAAKALTLGGSVEAPAPPSSAPPLVAADAPLTPSELVEAYASLALLGYAPPPLGSPGDARAAIRAALAPALVGASRDEEELPRRLLPGASLWLAAAAGGGGGEEEGDNDDDEGLLAGADDEGDWDEEDEDEDAEEGWQQDDDEGEDDDDEAAPQASTAAASSSSAPPSSASASTAQLLISAAFIRERPPQERAGFLSPELLARLAWAEGALSLGRGAGGGAGGDTAEQPPTDQDGWLHLSGPAAAAAAEAAWLDALAARLERAAPELRGPASAADALWGLATAASVSSSSSSSSRALEALGRRLAEELAARPEDAFLPAAVVGRVAAAVVCLSSSSSSFGGSGDNTTAGRLAALLSAPLQRRLALLLQERPESVGAVEISDVLGVAAMAAMGAAAGGGGGNTNGRASGPPPPALPAEPFMRAATLRLAEIAASAASAADFGGRGRASGARRRVLRSIDDNNNNEGGEDDEGDAAAASSACAPEDLAPHLVGALWACAALRYKPEPKLLHDVLAALGSGGGGGGGGGRTKNKTALASTAPQRALRRLSGRELCDLGWALACLRHRPGAAWLAAYAEEARARAPYLGGRPLADALWALAAFGLRPEKGWLRAVGAAVAARLGDGGLAARDAAVALWALEALGCADVSEVLVVEDSEGGDGALAAARERLVAALPAAAGEAR